MQGFAETARRARIAKRMSLRELAERLGLSVIYVSDMETGRRMPPSQDIAREWASVLNIEPDDFVTKALRDKRVLELPIEGEPEKKKEVAVMLARSWDTLTEAQQDELAEAFTRIMKEKA